MWHTEGQNSFDPVNPQQAIESSLQEGKDTETGDKKHPFH